MTVIADQRGAGHHAHYTRGVEASLAAAGVDEDMVAVGPPSWLQHVRAGLKVAVREEPAARATGAMRVWAEMRSDLWKVNWFRRQAQAAAATSGPWIVQMLDHNILPLASTVGPHAPRVTGVLHWNYFDDPQVSAIGRAKRRLEKRALRRLMGQGLHLVVHAEAGFEEWVDAGASVIPYGALERIEAVRTGPWPHDPLRLVVVGQSRVDRPAAFAVQVLAAMTRPATLHIAGRLQDTTAKALTGLADKAGVGDRVHIEDRELTREEYGRALADADVYLGTNARRFSGVSGPPLEALQVGLALMVPDLAAIRGTLGAAAQYYTAEDAEAAARALDQLQPPRPEESPGVGAGRMVQRWAEHWQRWQEAQTVRSAPAGRSSSRM